MHFSVMAEESMALLAIRPEGVYWTPPPAGRAYGTNRAATDHGVVIATTAMSSRGNGAAQHGGVGGRICFHHGGFGELAEAVAQAGFEKVDGCWPTWEVSRYQLTDSERGFSLMTDGPLDMRMDRTTGMTAADLVNYTAEKALADLIFQLGEERRARKVARAIVRARPYGAHCTWPV